MQEVGRPSESLLTVRAKTTVRRANGMRSMTESGPEQENLLQGSSLPDSSLGDVSPIGSRKATGGLKHGRVGR